MPQTHQAEESGDEDQDNRPRCARRKKRHDSMRTCCLTDGCYAAAARETTTRRVEQKPAAGLKPAARSFSGLLGTIAIGLLAPFGLLVEVARKELRWSRVAS